MAGIFNESARGRKKNVVAASAVAARDKPSPASGKPAALVAGTHQALARRAVGRGIRHSFESSTPVSGQLLSPSSQPDSTTQTPFPTPATLQQPPAFSLQGSTSNSLSELAINYRNTLNGLGSQPQSEPSSQSQMQMQVQSSEGNASDGFTGFLSRNSSLVDLAMLAPVDEALEAPPSTEEATNFGFVDFPNPDVYPPKADEGSSSK